MSATTAAQKAMRSRIVRYAELDPCRSAFIDTRTPGSEEKENFTIVGPGVAENPEQHVHIDIPHGFNIGGARQPPGCVNSQHSHETAEVFVVHTGRWAFNLGAEAKDGSIELGPGDTISIPTHVFRGFTNVGDDVGFLFAVLGGDDPGRVTWAPYVFEAAKKHGLVLLENGRLIDTTRGETVPEGARPMPPTTDEDVRRLRRMTASEIAECVVRSDELAASAIQPFPGTAGIFESPIVGDACDSDGTPAGRMAWPHGFHLRYVTVAPGAESPGYRRSEPEVIMMHAGELELDWAGVSMRVGTGDVATVPVGTERRFRNTGSQRAAAYVVRGTDQPSGFQVDT